MSLGVNRMLLLYSRVHSSVSSVGDVMDDLFIRNYVYSDTNRLRQFLGTMNCSAVDLCDVDRYQLASC